ncbi:Flp family type IVb pilin [Gymnodinialimonas ulvae]|uniref:Flp family type IVb pilin n=1 Tax=Gymnodinialimonas ulvae TaxID=3126504 RepID=UPI0030A58715
MFAKSTKRFLSDESGAITVDWVVLTAGVVGLALAAIVVISSGAENSSTDITNSLANTVPASSPFDDNQGVASASDVALD